MIELDINVELEKKLIKILKNKTQKFLEFLRENDIDIEDEEEMNEAIEQYEKKEKENKTIFGINKVLLAYTLALIVGNIDVKKQKKFKDKMKTKIFEQAISQADSKIRDLYINSTKRTAYFLDKYIEEIRKNKKSAKIDDFEKKIKDVVFSEKWEEAKQKIDEKMEFSNLLNTNNVLGETQAEYTKKILEELNINSFVWITKNDSRVREKHAWRNGKSFDMGGNLLQGTAEDSSKILPKQEWGCRCHMGIDEKQVEKGL